MFTDLIIGLALTMLRSLPASKVQDIVDAIGPILHINFMDRLPPEVCLRILGFLDPYSLLQIATASRGCFSIAFDWTLWQYLYFAEGFLINTNEVQRFEMQLREEDEERRSTRAPRHRSDYSVDGPPRKRSKPEPDNETGSKVIGKRSADGEVAIKYEDSDEPAADAPQSSIFGGPALSAEPPSQNIKTEPTMAAGNADPSDREIRRARRLIRSPPSMQTLLLSSQGSTATTSSDISRIQLDSLSSLVTYDRRTNRPRLNWQYLYSLRRKLESNWIHGRFINYMLPHPAHPEEAHTECIYTLQHDGKFVVSGSRDCTIRIWDLDTQRLVMRPLHGHTGSVLCLQFDASPEEDILVTGSSDAKLRVWRFSTGKCLHVISAHPKSVLNVRFDNRVLVTCSKDKTIRVFNRTPLRPGELGYKLPADFVVKQAPIAVNMFQPDPYAELPIKPPFTLLQELDGHAAAVNAVQIRGNEIVSASGDRNAKVWDWPKGKCNLTLQGHTKGIACVQYDGRRIVTGSNDNEIKVFDREKGVEVASLRGHTNLVRTVQVGFADYPWSVAEDKAVAKSVKETYFKAVEEGNVDTTARLGRKGARNAGSLRPEDTMAYGANLPPGGGGSRYARIVSGSYDESVIIWRRDSEGIWKAQQILKEVDASRAPLVAYYLNLPDPTDFSFLEQDILPGFQNQIGTHNWYRELADAAADHGIEALRMALVRYPAICQFPRLTLAVSNVADGWLRGRMRAVVQAGFVRENERMVKKIREASYELQNYDAEIKHLEEEAKGTGEEEIRRREYEAWAQSQTGGRGNVPHSDGLLPESTNMQGYQPQEGYAPQGYDATHPHPLHAQATPQYYPPRHGQEPSAPHYYPPPPHQYPAQNAPILDPPGPGRIRVPNPNIPHTNVDGPHTLAGRPPHTTSGGAPSHHQLFHDQAAAKQQRTKELWERHAYLHERRERDIKQEQNLMNALTTISQAHGVGPNPTVQGLPAGHPSLNPALGAGGQGGGGGVGGDGGQPAAVPAVEGPRDNGSRVFKLQFDARRIVASSQQCHMVVWDFANANRELEIGSKLFRGVGSREGAE